MSPNEYEKVLADYEIKINNLEHRVSVLKEGLRLISSVDGGLPGQVARLFINKTNDESIDKQNITIYNGYIE